jgi:hypothetical protein
MRRTAFRSLLLSVLVCTAACGAGPASAATLELKVVEPWRLVERGLSPGPLSGLVARLSYRSDGDGVDRVVVALDVVNGSAVAFLVRAPAATSVSRGCTQATPAGLWRCPIPLGAAPIGPRIGLGSGDDTASVPGSLHIGTVLWGGRGRDRLGGGGRLVGGPGGDTLRAAPDGRVRLEGGPGPDHIVGARGSDDIAGGRGADSVIPGRGRDTVAGGAGNDRIVASRDGPDWVGCESGADVARVDGVDLVDSLYLRRPTCERVVRSTPARAVPDAIYEETAADTVWFDVQCPWDLASGCVTEATLSIPRGRTLGTRRFRMAAGGRRYPKYYPPTERAVALMEARGAKATLVTYPPRGRPLKAVTVFDFDVYRGEG